jgi:hypothetical protein
VIEIVQYNPISSINISLSVLAEKGQRDRSSPKLLKLSIFVPVLILSQRRYELVVGAAAINSMQTLHFVVVLVLLASAFVEQTTSFSFSPSSSTVFLRTGAAASGASSSVRSNGGFNNRRGVINGNAQQQQREAGGGSRQSSFAFSLEAQRRSFLDKVVSAGFLVAATAIVALPLNPAM